jgi:hypothetical protein
MARHRYDLDRTPFRGSARPHCAAFPRPRIDRSHAHPTSCCSTHYQVRLGPVST